MLKDILAIFWRLDFQFPEFSSMVLRTRILGFEIHPPGFLPWVRTTELRRPFLGDVKRLVKGIFLLRLSRLLHKHKFAEAESFALQFGLEIEVTDC